MNELQEQQIQDKNGWRFIGSDEDATYHIDTKGVRYDSDSIRLLVSITPLKGSQTFLMTQELLKEQGKENEGLESIRQVWQISPSKNTITFNHLSAYGKGDKLISRIAFEEPIVRPIDQGNIEEKIFKAVLPFWKQRSSSILPNSYRQPPAPNPSNTKTSDYFIARENVTPSPTTQQTVPISSNASVPIDKLGSNQSKRMHNPYEALIGEKNRTYYLAKFEQFDRQGPGLKASWNWSAFCLSGVWALYRKMHGWFFVLWGIAMLSLILEKAGSPIWGALIFTLPWISFAIFANSLYHRSIKKKIAATQLSIKDEANLLKYLRNKGGVHAWVVWFFGFLPIFCTLAAIVIPMLSGLNDKREAEDWHARGKTYLESGQWAAASEAFTKAIRLDSKKPDYYFGRADCYMALNQPQKQLSDLDKVIELNPKLAPAFSSRGELLAGLGKYELAIRDHDKAIEIAAGKVEVAFFYLARGSTMLRVGNYQQAAHDLTKFLEVGSDPPMPGVYFQRGVAYLRLGNYNEAISDLKTSARLGHEGAQRLLLSEKISW